MDWKTLFLDANGRIGQKDFWIGWLILLVGGFVLGLIPIINIFAAIANIYFSVCLYAKRLHDMGKTAWLMLIPFGASIVGMVIVFAAGGAAIFAGSMGGDAAAAAGAAGGMIIAGLVLLLIFVVSIGFLLWIGLSKGDPMDNRFGPPRTQPLVTFV
jgi:uncharacterized membrane protein YhaH (DUF805 family)